MMDVAAEKKPIQTTEKDGGSPQSLISLNIISGISMHNHAQSQICALDLHFSLVSNGWTLDLTKKLSRNSPSDLAQPQPWHGAGRHAGDIVWRRIGASGLPRSCHRRGFPALKMKDTSQQPISSVK